MNEIKNDRKFVMKKIHLLLASLILTVTCQQSQAALIKSIDSGNWNDAQAWSGNILPAEGDQVSITHRIRVTKNTIYPARTTSLCCKTTLADHVDPQL
jgi:hypothetical protein